MSGEPAAEQGVAHVIDEIKYYIDRRIVGAHSALLALRSVPELELKPALDLLGPIQDSFTQICDLHEPTEDGSTDGVFVFLRLIWFRTRNLSNSHQIMRFSQI